MYPWGIEVVDTNRSELKPPFAPGLPIRPCPRNTKQLLKIDENFIVGSYLLLSTIPL